MRLELLDNAWASTEIESYPTSNFALFSKAILREFKFVWREILISYNLFKMPFLL